MATIGVPEGLFSTLMFGDNEEMESFLADDLVGWVPNSHHSSPSLLPYLFLMGDEDEAMRMEEEASAGDSPKAPPLKAEYIEKLEDVKVEESGSVCSICLDEVSKGSEAKRLPCSHMYHGKCIEEWLKRTNTCPICRREISGSS